MRTKPLRLMFQSTHPHGVRRLLTYPSYPIIEVSIHAPTRGATQARRTFNNRRKFQSTHPHGVRLRFVRFYYYFVVFQSTHPHGVRRRVSGASIRYSSFNPRTHMGCDQTRMSQRRLMRCFNPRTHMGCDGRAVVARQSDLLFQSTHPHGVRPLLLQCVQ